MDWLNKWLDGDSWMVCVIGIFDCFWMVFSVVIIGLVIIIMFVLLL